MNEKNKAQSPPEFFFMSELKGDRVVEQSGAVIGRLKDLEIQLSTPYPEVINLIVNRSFGRP